MCVLLTRGERKLNILDYKGECDLLTRGKGQGENFTSWGNINYLGL